MPRIAVAIAALTALLGGTVAARAADTPATGLVAKLAACDLTSASRSATFYARMETVPGATRLGLRFQLFERAGRGDWEKVDLPALRQWRTSQAGVKRFGWRQTVDNLHSGSAYRARVQYRWLTPAGAVVETESKDTAVCRAPLPNLAIGELTTRPGPTADTRVYRVEVRNTGKAALEDVDVSLSVDRAVLDTFTLARLAAGDARTVSFTGPACRREIRVEADPDNAIPERFESDNSQAFACP